MILKMKKNISRVPLDLIKAPPYYSVMAINKAENEGKEWSIYPVFLCEQYLRGI